MNSVTLKTSLALAAVTLLLGLGQVAGGQQVATAATRSRSTNQAAPADAVIIQAYDYGFTAPDAIPSGVDNFSFQNIGNDYHMAQFLKLNDGVTADDVLAAIENGTSADALRLGTPAGGANAIDGGAEEDFTLTLTPGNYVMLCFVYGDDGVPYAEKGAIKAFTVTDDVSPDQPPAADLIVTAQDGAFGVPAIAPGWHEVQFVNQGSDAHEMSVVEFSPSDDSQAAPQVQQVAAANDDSQGALQRQQDTDTSDDYDAEAYGGIAALAPGQTAWVTMDFEPGIYIFACFTPDPDTGLTYAAAGMTQTVVVQDAPLSGSTPTTQ